MSRLPDCSPEELIASPPEPAPTQSIRIVVEQCVELPDEDIAMRIANHSRMLVVDYLTGGGKKAPVDPKEQRALLAAADGIDRQALGRLRAKSESKLADAASQAMQLSDQILAKRDEMVARFRAGKLGSVLDMVPPPDGFAPIDGQTDINPPQEKYEEFRSRMNMG